MKSLQELADEASRDLLRKHRPETLKEALRHGSDAFQKWLHGKEERLMWPNPRIPYQMSNDRPRLTPAERQAADGQSGGRDRVLAVRAAMPRGILPAPHG